LAAIHAEAKKDCLRLFHLLFDEFFSSEECQNTVAFGKHGKVPEGKTVLEKSKVNGLLSKYTTHFDRFLLFILSKDTIILKLCYDSSDIKLTTWTLEMGFMALGRELATIIFHVKQLYSKYFSHKDILKMQKLTLYKNKGY